MQSPCFRFAAILMKGNLQRLKTLSSRNYVPFIHSLKFPSHARRPIQSRRQSPDRDHARVCGVMCREAREVAVRMKSIFRHISECNLRPLRARLSALICLLAWFAAMPSLLPACVAALGMLDGQHRVLFAEREGKITVVFHHEDGAMAQEHHHSPLTNALTVFAKDADSTQDHTFAFGQAGAATATARVLTSATPAALPPLLEGFVFLPLPQIAAEPSLAPRPPPVSALALVCLRSTSLRI